MATASIGTASVKTMAKLWKPDRDAYLSSRPKWERKMVRKMKAKVKRNLTVAKSAQFFESPEWRDIRYKALLKYGRRCACCGATPETGVILQVDHIKPRSKFPHLALNIDNLQILCKDCNLGKGAWDKTDFRQLPSPE